MFKLQIADPDVTSGTATVSWCVDQETLKYLSDKGINDPQVVIIVAPTKDNRYHIQREIRQVVPLKDMLAYVEFRRPGKNKIHAFISHASKKEALNRYLTKDYGLYLSWVLDHDGETWGIGRGGNVPETDATPIEVDLPKEVFAAEPSEWERAWVNHLFTSKCIDQCHFRKRRLFAYTVQPILFLFKFLLSLGALFIAALILARDISLKPILHPLQYSMDEAFKVCGGGSYVLPKLSDDNREYDTFSEAMWWGIRKLWLAPLLPILLIPFLFMLAAGKTATLGIVLMIILSVIVVITIALFLILGGLKGFVFKVMELLEGKESTEPWYLNQQEMDVLTCDTQKQPLTFKTLPASKKTLRLRFKDLKSKVCRPFAG